MLSPEPQVLPLNVAMCAGQGFGNLSHPLGIPCFTCVRLPTRVGLPQMSLRIQKFASSSRRKFSRLLAKFSKKKSGKTPPSDLSFPVEIWELIIGFLYETETRLFILLTVHSVFHRAVERVLYRHINLSGDHLHHAPRRIGLFERLADNPQISRLVESFVLTPLTTPAQGCRFPEAKTYYAAFRRAICSLTHLRSLTLIKLPVNRTWMNIGTPWGLDDLFHGSNFQLRRLSLGSFYTQSAASIEGRQHLIEELSVHHELDQTFSANAFPNLQALEVITQMQHVPHLLSKGGRPIRALYWTSWRPMLDGGPFPHVKSLRLAVVDGLEMSRLALVFPALRYLRIDFYKETIDWKTESFDELSQLLSLRKFVFGGLAPLGWRNFAFRRNIAHRLFSKMALLEHISLGLELWEKEKGDDVVLESDPEEWKDKKWCQ